VILLRVLGLLLATGGCGAAAAACLPALGLESRNARLLAFLLLFTAIQSLLILAAGLGGFLSVWPLTILGTAGGALLLRSRGAGAALAFRAPDRSEILFVAAAGVALLSLLVKAFLLVPYTGDALQYHLPKIAEWVQAERFRWGINHDPRVWFSGGFELVETWWVVFLHHDALIELGGLQMALVAVAAVATLAEAFDARPGLAAVAYLFIPGVLLNATACGNDLAIAALTLAGYAMVAQGAPRALQLFPLLLAVGVKATGGFAAVGVVAYAALRKWPGRLLPKTASLALVSSGMFLAAFWYIRNLLVAGHPLYPFYGSHGEFTWSPQQAGVDVLSLQSSLQVLDLRLLDREPYESLNRLNAGWGWAILPLGFPALLLGLRSDRRLLPLALSFALAACITLACVSFDDSNLRFILWFPALFTVALARRPTPAWTAAVLLACAINFAATLLPSERHHSDHIRTPASLPPAEPVAVVFDQCASSYRLYNRDYSRRVVYPRSMEELRRSGARFVYMVGRPSWAEPVRRWPSIAKDYYEVP
jgi:hypothetical protein